MAELYRTPPSRLLHLNDPLAAWALDEGVAHLIQRLRSGDRLRPKKTENNMDLLREMGVKIEGMEG